MEAFKREVDTLIVYNTLKYYCCIVDIGTDAMDRYIMKYIFAEMQAGNVDGNDDVARASRCRHIAVVRPVSLSAENEGGKPCLFHFGCIAGIG